MTMLAFDRFGSPVLLATMVIVGASSVSAQRPPLEATSESRRAITLRIEINDRSELELLTGLVSIDNVRGREVWATATGRQLEQLRRAGYTWKVVPAAPKAEAVMCPDGWENDDERSWSCYPTYEQYAGLMNGFASDHPDLCRLVDLGPGNNSISPHHLWAVVVSDNPDQAENEPQVLLTSSMHGDETAGYVLMLRLIDHLLEGYALDGDIGNLIDSTEIWINPLANPDGTYFGGDDSVADAIRNYTTTIGGDSGVNGNRNFPDPKGGDHPDGHSWWPETEIMMTLAATETFVLSANFHGGAEVVNYPWDTWQRRHPDNNWFVDLSRDYADLAQADSPGGYLTNPYNGGITNGYDWYSIEGGRQDFMTYFHGGREVTIELSTTKLLPADELDDLWRWNRRALIDFVGHAHHGIRGLVTDRAGTPLAATIEVVGVDREADGSMVRTDPAVGDYHRLLLPGLYDLRYEAEGFQPRLIEGIAVDGGGATIVDVVLYEELVLRPSRRVAPTP